MRHNRRVFEASVAAGLFVLVGLLAWGGADVLVTAGGLIGGVGLLASCVAGGLYHRDLRAALARRGPVPRGWWWAPSRFHPTLGPERRFVLRWFWRGGAMMGVCLLGLLMMGVGVVKAYLLP